MENKKPQAPMSAQKKPTEQRKTQTSFAKAEPQAKPKVQAPATKAEPQAKPKVQVPAAKAEPQAKPKVQAPATKAEPQVKQKVQAPATKAEPQAKPKVQAPATKAEPQAKPKVQVPAAKAEPQVKPKVQVPAAKAAPQAKQKEQSPAAKAEPQAKQKEQSPATKAEPQAKPKVQAPAAKAKPQVKQREQAPVTKVESKVKPPKQVPAVKAALQEKLLEYKKRLKAPKQKVAPAASAKNTIANIATKRLSIQAWQVALAIVVMFAVVAGAVYLGTILSNNQNGKDPIVDYTGELNDESLANPGGITMPGYPTLIFAANTQEVALELPNPKGNPCYFRYTLTIIETNTQIYQSELLDPGKKFETITLNQSLSKGTYTLRIEIDTFSLADGTTPMNGGVQEVTLIVK